MTEKTVAYLVNQYPKVSHSFIRREILALEQAGVAVHRMAMRGWDADLVDPLDQSELRKTHFILQQGKIGLLFNALITALRAPSHFLHALRCVAKLSRLSGKNIFLHLIYLVEACDVVRYARSKNVGHIHAHFGTNSAEVALLARVLGGPEYSFTVHGPEEFDKPIQLSLGLKARYAKFVVAISSYGKSQLFRWVDYAQWGKIKVVHCGLDNEFHNKPVQAPSSAKRLVCVGRICEQKGQLILLEAVASLVRSGVSVDLVLAGDGEMRPDVEQFIVKNNLQNNVTITGWISSERVATELLSATALVLPSFAEGLPVVIMEAMALRRPVITTMIAGIPELVRNGENGWLIPAGDVDALVDAMRDCIESTPERLQIMGDNARQRVLLRHSIDTEAAKLARLFAQT